MIKKYLLLLAFSLLIPFNAIQSMSLEIDEPIEEPSGKKKYTLAYALLSAITYDDTAHASKLLQENTFAQSDLDKALLALIDHSFNINLFRLLILKGAKINGSSEGDSTLACNNPLFRAIKAKNYAMVSALLEFGAAKNFLPLGFKYAFDIHDRELIDFLLDRGASVDEVVVYTENGVEQDATVLELAVMLHGEELALILLNHVHDISVHMFALNYACLRNYIQFIEAFIKKSPQLTQDPTTAWKCAINQESPQLIDCLAQYFPLPVELITFACSKEKNAYLHNLLRANLDTTDVTAGYQACLDVIGCEEFGSLLPIASELFEKLTQHQKSEILKRLFAQKEMKISLLFYILDCLYPLIAQDKQVKLDAIFNIVFYKDSDEITIDRKKNTRSFFSSIKFVQIPVFITLLIHPERQEFLQNKKKYITQAFAFRNSEKLRNALYWSIFLGDREIFEDIIRELSVCELSAEVFGNAAQQISLVNNAIMAPHQNKLVKVAIISMLIVELKFPLTQELIAQIAKEDDSIATGLVIFQKTSQGSDSGLFDLIGHNY